MRQPLCLQAAIRQGQVRKHLVEAKEQMMDIEAPDDAVSTFSLSSSAMTSCFVQGKVRLKEEEDEAAEKARIPAQHRAA